MKKTSFQKTLKVLKPLYLLCRMHIAEGSPIKKAIKKVKKTIKKSSKIDARKVMKKHENHLKMTPKWVLNPLKIHPKIDPEKRCEKEAGTVSG